MLGVAGDDADEAGEGALGDGCASRAHCLHEGQSARVSDVTRLLVAIATSDHQAALDLLDVTPSLVTAGVARRDEFFLAERLAQVYEGDTALHAAAFSYDAEMARQLVTTWRGRAGEEPEGCRTAPRGGARGVPGSAHWNPTRQADGHPLPRRGRRRPQRTCCRWGDTAAPGGAKPMLGCRRGPAGRGADARLENDRGLDRVRPRGVDDGSKAAPAPAAARAEQRIIIELLNSTTFAVYWRTGMDAAAPSDGQLVEAAGGRATLSSLGLLLERHRADMRAVAVARLGYGTAAEDAVQDRDAHGTAPPRRPARTGGSRCMVAGDRSQRVPDAAALRASDRTARWRCPGG